jgi:hypothetical protein
MNKIAMQNDWQQPFLEPCGGSGPLWDKLAHFVNLMKMIVSSLPSVTHTVYRSHFQTFFYTFHHKKRHKGGF